MLRYTAVHRIDLVSILLDCWQSDTAVSCHKIPVCSHPTAVIVDCRLVVDSLHTHIDIRRTPLFEKTLHFVEVYIRRRLGNLTHPIRSTQWQWFKEIGIEILQFDTWHYRIGKYLIQGMGIARDYTGKKKSRKKMFRFNSHSGYGAVHLFFLVIHCNFIK